MLGIGIFSQKLKKPTFQTGEIPLWRCLVKYEHSIEERVPIHVGV